MSKRYSSLNAVLMAFRDGKVNQKYVENYQRSLINEEKSKNCVKAGANLPSQWGRVVTNEQRLIDNGHFMKSRERATLESTRESVKDLKIAEKHGMTFEEYRHAKRFGTLPKIVERVEKR